MTLQSFSGCSSAWSLVSPIPQCSEGVVLLGTSSSAGRTSASGSAVRFAGAKESFPRGTGRLRALLEKHWSGLVLTKALFSY